MLLTPSASVPVVPPEEVKVAVDEPKTPPVVKPSVTFVDEPKTSVESSTTTATTPTAVTPTEKEEEKKDSPQSTKDSSTASSSEPPPKKAKRASWKKPKSKPKRPLSAYNLFFQKERHLKENKGRGFANLARTIGAKWKKLDSTSKSRFEEVAKLEKIRYMRELKIWKANRMGIRTSSSSVAADAAAVLEDAATLYGCTPEHLFGATGRSVASTHRDSAGGGHSSGNNYMRAVTVASRLDAFNRATHHSRALLQQMKMNLSSSLSSSSSPASSSTPLSATSSSTTPSSFHSHLPHVAHANAAAKSSCENSSLLSHHHLARTSQQALHSNPHHHSRHQRLAFLHQDADLIRPTTSGFHTQQRGSSKISMPSIPLSLSASVPSPRDLQDELDFIMKSTASEDEDDEDDDDVDIEPEDIDLFSYYGIEDNSQLSHQSHYQQLLMDCYDQRPASSAGWSRKLLSEDLAEVDTTDEELLGHGAHDDLDLDLSKDDHNLWMD